MKKAYLILSVACICVLSISSSTEENAKNEKITICHVPPGNPANMHPITISVKALTAHMAHGDFMGGCLDN